MVSRIIRKKYLTPARKYVKWQSQEGGEMEKVIIKDAELRLFSRCVGVFILKAV